MAMLAGASKPNHHGDSRKTPGGTSQIVARSTLSSPSPHPPTHLDPHGAAPGRALTQINRHADAGPLTASQSPAGMSASRVLRAATGL